MVHEGRASGGAGSQGCHFGLKLLILCEVTTFHGAHSVPQHARCSLASEVQLQLTQTPSGVCPGTRFTANNEVLLHRC